VRVSLQSAVNNVILCGKLVEQTLDIEKGQTEYVVATKLLYLDALSSSGFQRVACSLAAHATAAWPDLATAELETIARNCLHLDASTHSANRITCDNKKRGVGTQHTVPNYKHTLVARIKTILGRDLHQHDRDAELAERTVVTQPHYYNANDDGLCDCWANCLFRILCQYAQEALSTAPNMPQTADAWWHNRAMWLSGGTSSNKMPGSRLRTSIDNTKHHVRMTKKLVCSHLSEDWLRKALKSEPKMQCRAATKNEPGLKLRPLRASDDASYLIAAMASNNLEKYLSIKGSVMRQTPDDVRATTNSVVLASSLRRRFILCIDYSNFNNTHTTRSRSMLNLAMALAFQRINAPSHAAAALWLALAQLNHTIDGHLSNQGLSSGERDTARDNTMLHNAYATMAKMQVAKRYSGEPATTQMCGDDEIAIGASWSWCVRYTREHKTQGHQLQQRKLMLSNHLGEFLQYNMAASRLQLPTQPLAPALNNFVSGSWYKTANYNATEYPQQVAAAAASCIRRGATHSVMAAMAISTCSWLCEGLPWKTMLHATPLFGMADKQPKCTKSEAQPATQWLRHTQPQAADDYLKALHKRLQLTPPQVNIVKKHLANSIFSTLLADIKNSSYSVENADQPARVTVPAEATADSMHIYEHWAASLAENRYDEMTWLAVQIGVPPELVKEIGMHTIVSKSSNSMRSHINIPNKGPQRLISASEYAMLPGAIAPYFTATPNIPNHQPAPTADDNNERADETHPKC